MQKLGNWGVQVCGCTKQGLKLYPGQYVSSLSVVLKTGATEVARSLCLLILGKIC